ncbi:hypothetical protein [Polyangium jinanense]|uniref:Tetratricopeptide repeat protein n=1 Tax=Polyangium jinanense TaxID=2829994 RepID=A0A9X3XAE7_9BACT|nr:hypothetical protein [Polyangium jinanense]MDC3957039.1 hypothetical protein [Polyangium jinanense]MDC3987087.1 hypothetical protein [Polyangium jinanense]
MTCSRNRVFPWLVAALLVSAAAPAVAGEPQGPPSAQDLYVSAQKLFDQGHFAEALVGFRHAYNASGSPNARIMIGNCLVALGRTAEAYEEMSATLREATKRAETEPKYVPTRDAAAKHVALLESKVGKLVVEIADPAGVEVTVNGSRVPPEKFGVAFAVDPGTVVVAATRADGRVARQEQTVEAGASERVSLVFPDVGPKKIEPTGPVRVEGPKPPGGDELRTGGAVRTAGFVVAGIGVAGMAIFGVTGLMARSRFATLEEECHATRCTDLKYADVVDSGMALTTAANTSLAIGAAGIVGGGLMILFGGPSFARPAARSAPSGTSIVAPQSPVVGAGFTMSPGGAGVHCTVAF